MFTSPLLFFSFILMSQLVQVESIKCYQCGVLPPPLGVDCKSKDIPSTDCGEGFTACVKAVVDNVVTKGCMLPAETALGCKKGSAGGHKGVVCGCNTDLCNSAQSYTTLGFGALLTLALCFWKP